MELLADPDWASIKSPPVIWPSHEEHKKSKSHISWTEALVSRWREENNITVEGADCPPPFLTFSDCPFPKYMHAILTKEFGFTEPTPVQAQSWGIALHHRDIVGIAQTGSGKTLSYLCPAIVHILSQPRLEKGEGPLALILSPTRELSQQIESVCRKLTTHTPLGIVCAHGGLPREPQRKAFKGGTVLPHIAICCPGRLIDLLVEGSTTLRRVSFFVLDEADRMLDMGFDPQIRALSRQVRPHRQTLMFSATWPYAVQQLANWYLRRDYLLIHVGGSSPLHGGGGPPVNSCVTQRFLFVSDKPTALLQILQEEESLSKTLVFVATRSNVDYIVEGLEHNGIRAFALHGDKKQSERDHSLHTFRKSHHRAVLVATDVAQRGLDMHDLDAVVNYDVPTAMVDYIHRIGRVGRTQGSLGLAYTLFTHKDRHRATDLAAALETSGHEVPNELKETIGRYYTSNGPYGKGKGNDKRKRESVHDGRLGSGPQSPMRETWKR